MSKEISLIDCDPLANKSTTRKNYLKYPLLCFALAVWVFIPIIGIFPLILFVHLNYKKSGKSILNLIILSIVVLTNAIFVSSLNVQSDTAVYISRYEQLGEKSIFELAFGEGLEFIIYAFSYPIYVISNGSRYAFLLFWVLSINALTVYICKKFSPRNSGLLLFYAIASPSFLGSQGFLMRQFIANTFLIAAIANYENKFRLFGLYILSFCTHSFSIIYLPILLIKNKLNKSLTKILMLRGNFGKLVSMLVIGAAIAISIAFPLNQNRFSLGILLIRQLFGETTLSDALVKKSNYWSGDRAETDIPLVVLAEFLFMGAVNIYAINSGKDDKSMSSKYSIMSVLFAMLLILIFLTRAIGGFLSLRVGLLLFTFIGIFYYNLLDRKWDFKFEVLRSPLIFLTLTVKFILFIAFLYNLSQGKNPLNFLDSQPFTSSIFEYINIAYRGLTRDIDI